MKKNIFRIVILLLILSFTGSSLTACKVGGYEFESREETNQRKERLLEYLEERYGVDFEITRYGSSGGSIGSVNSFYVKSDKYPFETSVTIFNENEDDERIRELYGLYAFEWDSNLYLQGIFEEINKGNIIYHDGSIGERGIDNFDEKTYDLETLSFENTYLNDNPIENDGSISLYHFADRDEEVYTELNELLWEYAKLFKSNNGLYININVSIFDEKALETEFYSEYLKEEISLNDLESEMLQGGFMLKHTGGYFKIELSQINSAEDIKEHLIFSVDKTKEKK